jgi:hypothetical protein
MTDAPFKAGGKLMLETSAGYVTMITILSIDPDERKITAVSERLGLMVLDAEESWDVFRQRPDGMRWKLRGRASPTATNTAR